MKTKPGIPPPSRPRLLLALETATDVCAVALLDLDTGRVLGEHALRVAQQHGARLVPLIDIALALLDATVQDLRAVAVSGGPGSYTGLRIGASTAKGYCAALGLPLVPVPTLDAIALGTLAAVAEGEELLVSLPSRRGEVYAALYTRDGDALVVERTATPLAVEDVAGWAWTRNLLVLAGPGTDRLAPFFPHAPRLSEAAAGVSAAPVARLAADLLAEGLTADLDAWAPEYLKPFVPGGG